MTSVDERDCTVVSDSTEKEKLLNDSKVFAKPSKSLSSMAENINARENLRISKK